MKIPIISPIKVNTDKTNLSLQLVSYNGQVFNCKWEKLLWKLIFLTHSKGNILGLHKLEKLLDISNKLLSLTTNNERVLYVYHILRELKAFPKILEVKKNYNVSVHYRNLGNKFFQKLMYYQAWQYYNLALLHAIIDSEVYSLALSNRSAVFHSLKKYKQCLQDIQTVFSMKYSEKIKDKLNNRKSSCEQYLVKESHKDEVPIALSVNEPRNSRYPCASSKLAVVSSKEMGRHVVANDKINVGEVLVEEDPYFVLLLKSQYLFCCSYCISRNLNLMPCDKCCFALYCSNECKENAWKQYHSVECGLMPTLFKMDFTKLELLALRVVIKARTDHENWLSHLQTIKDIEANDNTEYQGCVKVNNKWVYDSKYYATIHTLATNIDRRSVSDIFQKAVTAAVLFYFLKTRTTFLNGDDKKLEKDIRNCVAGSLLLHVMTSATNMHGLSTNMENGEGNYVDVVSVACAPYGFLSLLNHSCAPNVVRLSNLGSGTMKLIALRPIQKGQQLYDNYGAHHAIQGLQSRQADLKFQYKFNCRCEACIDDWPPYPLLPSARTYPTDKILTHYAIQKLQKGDPCIALKIYTQLCEAMTALEPKAPCSELADCQESMKQCLAIFEGLLPYGYSQLIDCDPIPPKL